MQKSLRSRARDTRGSVAEAPLRKIADRESEIDAVFAYSAGAVWAHMMQSGSRKGWGHIAIIG